MLYETKDEILKLGEIDLEIDALLKELNPPYSVPIWRSIFYLRDFQ